MRPLLLKGHERPITKLVFNREGDLLFSVAKDTHPTVWAAENGERLGTYEGHTGACYSVDVNYNSTMLLTGSADNSLRIWDVKSGEELGLIKHDAPVRACSWASHGRLFATGIDNIMGAVPAINIFRTPAEGQAVDTTPVLRIEGHEHKINYVLWGPMNDVLYSCSEDNTVRKWDVETGKELCCNKDHTKGVNTLAMSRDYSHIVSSSADNTSMLFDANTLEKMKTYKTERPVNAATLSPDRNHVILGGGQDASMVTTTSSRVGHFQVKFFHKLFEEEIGNVKGHFGPVNALAFSPTGKGFASGGEDGFVRMHHFDASYFSSVL